MAEEDQQEQRNEGVDQIMGKPKNTNLRKREFKLKQKLKEESELSPLNLQTLKDCQSAEEISKTDCKIINKIESNESLLGLEQSKKQTNAKRAPK